MKIIFVWLLAIVFLIDSVLLRHPLQLQPWGADDVSHHCRTVDIRSFQYQNRRFLRCRCRPRSKNHLFLLLRRFCAAAYIRRGERLLRHRDQTGKSGDRTGRRPARRTRDRPFGTPSGCRI